MAGLTDAGLEVKTQPEIETELDEAIHAPFPGLNLSSSSPLGQYKGATSSQLAQLWEGLQALWASWDPRQATGAALDRIGALTGTTRRGATHSTVNMNVTLAAGTYTAGTLVVSKLSDSTIRFSNVSSVVAPGGLVTGVAFQAEETGPLAAGAGTLTVIANPVTGFTAATNPSDAVIGQNAESNADFRRRRELELATKGSTTADAIRADLLQATTTAGLPMFDFVAVIENDTDVAVGGIPPHAFETIVVTAASSSEIGAALLKAKPAGIRSYGTTTATVNDSQSNPHVVGWTNASDVNLYVWVNVSAIAGQYEGESAVKTALTDYAEVNQSVGNDFVRARYTQIVMDMTGVVDVDIRVGTSNVYGSAVQTNWTVAQWQIARLDATRITVTPTYVTGTP